MQKTSFWKEFIFSLRENTRKCYVIISLVKGRLPLVKRVYWKICNVRLLQNFSIINAIHYIYAWVDQNNASGHRLLLFSSYIITLIYAKTWLIYQILNDLPGGDGYLCSIYLQVIYQNQAYHAKIFFHVNIKLINSNCFIKACIVYVWLKWHI